MPTQETEVLVVGAGPVGLFTALCLSERGARVRIVDMYRRTALRSYALALHPQTLRMLDELDLAEPLIDRGYLIEKIVVHQDEVPVATIDLASLPGAFPFVLALPQSLLEGALEKRLADNGVEVGWNQQALAFDTDGDSVTALIGTLSGSEASAVVSTTRIRSSYLVGADGPHSFVRRSLNLDFEVVGPPIAYGLVEFESTLEHANQMNLIFRDESVDVLWPIEPARGRWGVQLRHPDEVHDVASLKALVRKRAPWFGGDFGAVDWVTTVGFERGLAKRFGRERVWLAGDSARFTSPVGVQNMNVGLREAYDLARRIAAILQGSGSPKLLQYYNEERQREWKMMLGIKQRLKVLPKAPAAARKLTTRLMSALPASGRDLNVLLEQVGLRLDWLRRGGCE